MIRRLLSAWRRARREIEKLELWQVLHQRGTYGLARHNSQALAFAVERCMACRQVPDCGRALEAGPGRGLEAFCPNTMYLRHLEAMKRHGVTAKR
jgi:hypothetical protein